MSLPFGAACSRLGVTLPSMKADDCDTRLILVGVIGIETLWFRDGGVYELVRLP
jgi:hypothetical protein